MKRKLDIDDFLGIERVNLKQSRLTLVQIFRIKYSIQGHAASAY